MGTFPNTVPDLTLVDVAPSSLIVAGIKAGFILVAIMYIVYSVILVRQVNIMNTTIKTPLGPIIQVAAWIHLALAVLFMAGVLLLP